MIARKIESALAALLAFSSSMGCGHPAAVLAPEPAIEPQAATSRAASAGPISAPMRNGDDEVSEDCGTALLRRASLLAQGYGKNHPALRALEEKVASCPREAEVPADLCGEALLERQALELAGAGPKHPAMMAAVAKLTLCTSPIRVTKDQCLMIQKSLLELESSGLGQRHPEVLATQARFDACEAARRASPPVAGTAHLILRGGSGEFADLDEPLKALGRSLGVCAPIDAERRFSKDMLKLTIVMDRKRVTDARVSGEKAPAEASACVTQVAMASALRGSPASKLTIGVELTHGYYE